MLPMSREITLNELGRTRLELRAGPYSLRGGFGTLRFDVNDGAETSVTVSPVGLGELSISVPGTVFLGHFAGRMLPVHKLCEVEDEESRRFLYLAPGEYSLYWGPGAFFIGAVGVRADLVTSPRVMIPPAKIDLAFPSLSGRTVNLWIDLRGGPAGFIDAQSGLWRVELPIRDSGASYTIEGLHPGEYTLSVRGDVNRRGIKVVASTSPQLTSVSGD